MVTNIFKETARWKLLAFFFQKPEREGHVNGLARDMKISAGAVSMACRQLAKWGALKKTKKGNALFYALNNDNPLVKRLKAAWFLEKLLKLGKTWENEEFQCVALYGSYASGEFISKSDVDLLVLTNADESLAYRAFEKLRNAVGAELSLTILPLGKWHGMAMAKDRFYIEVLANHIVLYGSSPVV